MAEVKQDRYFVELGSLTFKSFIQDNVSSISTSKADKLARFGQKCLYDLRVEPENFKSIGISKAVILTARLSSENAEELIELAADRSVRELQCLLQTFSDSAIEERLDGMAGDPMFESSSKTPIVHSSPSGPWRYFLTLRPAEEEFYVEDDVWEQLVYAATHAKTTLLVGPAGCGKSEVVARIAESIQMPMEAFNLGNCADPRATFLGTTQLKSGQTQFFPSQFAEAFGRGGTLFLLDELNRCRQDAADILLTALDSQGYLDCDETGGGKTIKRGPGNCFFSTANIGSVYTGTNEIDHALADRQKSLVELDFPPVEKEAKILINRYPGLDATVASRLTRIAEAQRELFKKGDFSIAVSTRQLLATAEQSRDGINLDRAFRFCVVNKFLSDGGEESERSQIEKLFQAF